MAALEAARARQDLVVVTGTASGKTLCYNLPILEAALADPQARALYLFPTKALAQDQLKGLLELVGDDPELAAAIRPGVYDGDTPTAQRRRIRSEANLVLSNPDMLHAAVLPYHPKWAAFFADLRYVVIDEVHTYRGILGAHVSAVLRRLDARLRALRLAAGVSRRQRDDRQSGRTGGPARRPRRDGDRRRRLAARPEVFRALESRAAGQRFARPPQRERRCGHLAGRSDRSGRAGAGLHADAASGRVDPSLRPRATRRPSTRRWPTRCGPIAAATCRTNAARSSRSLFSGNLRGVAATNALELGIDIGTLDVALLVNYPGTIASSWQQAGRSGRRHDESLAVLLAGNDPVDQYLLRHPEYFFAQIARARGRRSRQSVRARQALAGRGVRAAARRRSTTSIASARWPRRSPVRSSTSSNWSP